MSNTNEKKQQILNLISEYFKEKRNSTSWDPSKDWVAYSGPNYDEKEFVAAIDTLLDEWLIFGKNCRSFEEEFRINLYDLIR
jgi:CDP-6-deoxy-D-xylo-4-hexulose-3-dehydrase